MSFAIDNFIQKVAEMRKAQADYFRYRDPAILRECKRLERDVDKDLADLLHPANEKQKSLLGEP